MSQEIQQKPKMRPIVLVCAAVLAIAGAVLAFCGSSLDSITGTFQSAWYVNPEMLLCLAFVLGAGLSLIRPIFGAAPFWGLSLYSGYMILFNLSHYRAVSSLVYVGAILALSVILIFALKGRGARVAFTVGGVALAILLALGSMINEGPYFFFVQNAEGLYVYARVFLSKAVGAVCLILATSVFVWARPLSCAAEKAVSEASE